MTEYKKSKHTDTHLVNLFDASSSFVKKIK